MFPHIKVIAITLESLVFTIHRKTITAYEKREKLFRPRTYSKKYTQLPRVNIYEKILEDPHKSSSLVLLKSVGWLRISCDLFTATAHPTLQRLDWRFFFNQMRHWWRLPSPIPFCVFVIQLERRPNAFIPRAPHSFWLQTVFWRPRICQDL